MRWPAVLGSTQHPASQGTAGLRSSRLPGELGKTEGPGCTRVWLETSGAKGPLGGMGCTLVTAGLCLTTFSQVCSSSLLPEAVLCCLFTCLSPLLTVRALGARTRVLFSSVFPHPSPGLGTKQILDTCWLAGWKEE